MTQYLGIADLLLIAEAALRVPAEDVHRICDIGGAESALAAPAACFGEYEVYPTMARKAAVLAFRLCRNHPLLDGNKRVAYLAMCEFVERNGYTWTPPKADAPDGDETVKVMWDLAAGQITEEELAIWVAERIGESP
ncbi:MAG: type II toxin-antitoxin system death-on-curing family toxin [Marmoricola sp.]